MKNKKKRIITILLAAASLAAVLSGCGRGDKFQDATHELGAAGLTVEVFLKEGIRPGKAVFVTDMKSLDLSVPGTHDVKLSYGGREETVPYVHPRFYHGHQSEALTLPCSRVQRAYRFF